MISNLILKNNKIIAKKSEGSWIWDKNDYRYLDMTTNIGALSKKSGVLNVQRCKSIYNFFSLVLVIPNLYDFCIYTLMDEKFLPLSLTILMDIHY